MGCTILCWGMIGDNTIIGTKLVVSEILKENSIYAGNSSKEFVILMI